MCSQMICPKTKTLTHFYPKQPNLDPENGTFKDFTNGESDHDPKENPQMRCGFKCEILI